MQTNKARYHYFRVHLTNANLRANGKENKWKELKRYAFMFDVAIGEFDTARVVNLKPSPSQCCLQLTSHIKAVTAIRTEYTSIHTIRQRVEDYIQCSRQNSSWCLLEQNTFIRKSLQKLTLSQASSSEHLPIRRLVNKPTETENSTSDQISIHIKKA